MILRYEGCVLKCLAQSSCTCDGLGGTVEGMREWATVLHLARHQSATGYLRERERNLHSKQSDSPQQQCH